ncbi:MAG: sigma-54 dependent transcriptional regulator [Elusimicrobia bacterium]|nr:sigma-54 dependent transcriptional regulator [Elusimicrobiota bacterium]
MASKNGKNILIVDDSLDTLELIKRNLKSKNYTVVTASSAQSAVDILENHKIDLLITDLKMPKVDGLNLIKHVKRNYNDLGIIMITGFATIDGAVKAIKAGSEEFIPKPFTDQELFKAIEKVLANLETRRSAAKKQTNSIITGMIGDSHPMKKVYARICKAASTSSATVFITGESGTGKELAARAIHYTSSRSSDPFIPIHCAGIPEELLENELFGHVKGSFTGAYETRAGFFQTADGGTIFLDEIAETPLSIQVKLLRVLQEKEIFMIGSRKSQKVNVRIIAATNKDIEKAVESGSFRKDLFYRLNVVNIKLPPLRERGNDIFLLLNLFLEKFSKELNKPLAKFSDETLDILKNYSWPGNVRELQNVINQITIMSEGEIINVSDLPKLFYSSTIKNDYFNAPLSYVIKDHIQKVLENHANNKTKAAKTLGIDRKTLAKYLNSK